VRNVFESRTNALPWSGECRELQSVGKQKVRLQLAYHGGEP